MMVCSSCGKTVVTPMDHIQVEKCDECSGARRGVVGGGEFNPLGGAARGVGRCTCAAGPGTNPACPVHP